MLSIGTRLRFCRWVKSQFTTDTKRLKPLPIDNVYDWSKLKAFVDNKINVC